MDEPFGKRGIFEDREVHELDPFKIGEFGEALHQIERFLGELFIDHFDGETRVHEHIAAYFRLRREVEGNLARYAEDIDRGKIAFIDLFDLGWNRSTHDY